MKRICSLLCCLFLLFKGTAQSLFVAGPMLGYTELRSSRVWVEVQPAVTQLSLSYRTKSADSAGSWTMIHKELEQEKGTQTFTLSNLSPGTCYEYKITAAFGKRTETKSGLLNTQELWNWRKPAPDFSFITGSCAYFNEPAYDRPGKPYGGDSSIFIPMAASKADFMLWLGDNWYTREVDYFSPSGLRYRARRDRSLAVLQPLLQAMPHYAIWDDHDYGPNDFSYSYVLKGESRNVFTDYWANPSYGMDGKGIYTQFVYSDVAFFLLDDRSWRSNDAFKDSISDKPDHAKQMFGAEQMRWLKDALLSNHGATFKVIASGSQMLNPVSVYDCFRHYGAEYQELLDFLEAYKIEGVLFLTGDRHHSEIIKIERPHTYPLYDITVSPLTSHVYAPGGAEKDMAERVPGTLIAEQNFARISVKGAKGSRELSVHFLDIKGAEKAKWSIKETELK